MSKRESNKSKEWETEFLCPGFDPASKSDEALIQVSKLCNGYNINLHVGFIRFNISIHTAFSFLISVINN